MSDQELDKINDYVHGLRDRLAYLEGKNKEEFEGYLDTLFNAYPSPKKVLYGFDVIKTIHR